MMPAQRFRNIPRVLTHSFQTTRSRTLSLTLALVILTAALMPVFGTTGAAHAAEDQAVMLGVWQPPTPGDFGPLVDLEGTLGRSVDIVPWYQAWDSSNNSAFRSDKVQWALDRGSIPMITWEPWNTKNGVNQSNFALSQISNGTHDSYIRSWAKAAQQINGPIYLRFAHEMNGNWYPWAAGVNGNSAEDYIQAWKHVHGIFEAEGATNVQWIWSPNRDYPGAISLPSLFPGDAYVDWVAIDGYNFGTEKSGMTWRSFNDTFKGTYDILTGLSSKPVMIGETGSTETGGDKAAWIREGLSAENLAANFPRMRAIIYFNQVGSGNWPLSTSRTAADAFTEVVQSWLEATPQTAQAPAPAPEPPAAAESGGQTQAGRARAGTSESPSQLLGAWWSGVK